MVQNDAIHTSEDYVNYTFNISSKGVGQVTGELLGLSNTVSIILGDIAFKTAETLSNIETLSIGTGLAIGGLFISATKDAIRFEQQMANVKAIGGESLNAQEIGSAAMEYSNKFGMATASMTEGLESLARAGITTTSVMKGVLEEGVKLSKLEGMDLEDSINDLISTTNLLAPEDVNMNDSQYAEMVKQMNQHIVSTSESAPINAQNIIQSLQHVGGYASASGIDQDDLFAVIAQLGSRGTKGEMAGTALRAFIAAGQKDTAQRALARIGLKVTDLWDDDGNTMLPLSEMKDVLDKALEQKGYSKQEKLEFYSDFAGYKQANQIMKIDTSEVQKYKEQIANAWDLGQKLDTILGTVRGNLDRIWQITQNFMTKVGGKFLFIANAILTPVRILLEVINKMPFADTAVAVGMIVIGFSGALKIINNIVPRFSDFFVQLSQSKKDALSIRNVWRKMPDDIQKAKDTLAAMNDPKKMLQIQHERQLYSKSEMETIENRVARLFYIEANWNDERLSDMNEDDKKQYLKEIYDQQDNISKKAFINQIKVQDPEKWEKAVSKYMNKTIAHANDMASKTSYDIDSVVSADKLISIDKYVAWIWGFLSGEPTKEESSNNTPPSESQGPRSNRERNAEERQARANARQADFVNIRESVLRNKYEYGDYSYHVNPTIGMRQFQYNDIDAIRRFEEKVQREIENKERMYIDFLENKNIEAGRNRLKKSLTVAAKTDLGYEFSTGANTADIKHILETGHIRPGSSKILNEQLQTIADALDTNTTGDQNADMQRFHRILDRKNNKDEILESILDTTQKQWNDKYYNNGKVGFFPTKVLEQASDGATAQKIMEKVGVNSIREVQEHFKNVDLDDSLLNECVDIMYEDKALVNALVNEEIRYMYENLARVQNSLYKASSRNNSTFESKGEEYETNLKKAREYVLDEFNPNDFENYSSSPFGKSYDISKLISLQDDMLHHDIEVQSEDLEAYQHYIYPIGTDIANSQRYGNNNFQIKNIRFVPDNHYLEANTLMLFDDTEDITEYEKEVRLDFIETFMAWAGELAWEEGKYWDNSFNIDFADDYWISGFEGGKDVFDSLKQEFEDIYRAYIDLCAYGAQDLIESSQLPVGIKSYRGGRLYTPENEFGAFDTITSTSLHWGVARAFWNENPYERDMMEIFSPEGVNGILGHKGILNSYNDHLWQRERELTLGIDQAYLHIPNEDDNLGVEKRLLALTDDQQKAVKEIMGGGFEFIKNQPNAYEKAARQRKIEETDNWIEKQKALFKSAGESPTTLQDISDENILTNRLSALLNKEVLTKENMGDKLQDLFMNGAILVNPRYGSGSSGSINTDDTIDINTGSIRYNTKLYPEEYGDYGTLLLDTVVHEMTHILMMHNERLNHEKNNLPSELGITNFKSSDDIYGYNDHFVAEYEAQYVTSQVLNRLGIESNQKNQDRMAGFKEEIEKQGYEYQIQYELLDSLVDEMLNNISVIGDITEELSTQIDGVRGNITIPEIYDYMRPIMTKIQAFNKNASVYQGPNTTGKKRDEIDQVLSDMEKDMEKLWNSGISDKTLMYNLIKQKYLPYIESLNDYSFDTYYSNASPVFSSKGQTNLSSTLQSLVKEFGEEQVRKELNNILKISNNSQGYRDGHVSWLVYDSLKQLKADGKTRGVSYDELKAYMTQTYDKTTALSGVKWLKEHATDTMLLKGGKISTAKGKTLKGIEQYNDLTRIVSDVERIELPDSGKIIELPIHSANVDEIKKGGMKKYLLKHTDTDMRNFKGILDILNSDSVRNLSKKDVNVIHKAIAAGEGSDWRKRANILKADKKVGDNTGVINTSTAADCVNRAEDAADAVCGWCNQCYAWIQMFKPNVARMQIDRSIFFREHTAEELADIVRQSPYKKFRINQEGDFRDIDDYYKIAKIAELNPDKKFYGYTKVMSVLNELYENGAPKNLQINNSLDTWDREGKAKGNYIAANWREVIKFLDKGYNLCKGACDDCAQCLSNIDKVTILRDGAQPLDVGSLKDLTVEGQKEVFKRLLEEEEQGKKVNETVAKKIVDDVYKIQEFVRPQHNKTTFASKGENPNEDKRLPELMDWIDILTQNGNVLGVGYGVNKQNMLDFIATFNDKLLAEDTLREMHGDKPLPKGYAGDRLILTGKEFFESPNNIKSVKSRLMNFGIYWNKKSATEAKETGIEELINLFDKDAVREALAQNIITENQLKKWHKQLQDSIAVMNYGEVPWDLDDVAQWTQEKNEADKKLAEKIRIKKEKEDISTFNAPFVMNEKIREWVEKSNKTSSQTTLDDFISEKVKDYSKETSQAYIDFYKEEQENIEKRKKAMIDNYNQQLSIENNARKNAESYKDFYQNEEEVVQKRNEAIWESFDTIKNMGIPIMGNSVGIGGETSTNINTEDTSTENINIDEELLKILQTKYTKNAYEDLDKFGKARYYIREGGNNKWLLKGVDLTEKAHNFANNQVNNLFDILIDKTAFKDDGTNMYQEGAKKIKTYQEQVQNFQTILQNLSEIFPILTPAVLGLDMVLQGLAVAMNIANGVSAFRAVTLNKETAAEELNKLATEGNTTAIVLNTLAKYKDMEGTIGNKIYKITDNITKRVNKGIGSLLGMEEGALISLLTSLLPILAIVGVIATTIAGLYFWEKQHAKALKESQKALEESIAKNNIALSQYKDLKKARENETDVIKKQQKARKEAIALYELEASRLDAQKKIKKESDARNHSIWGEYGLRADSQKMGWLQAFFRGQGLGLVAKWQAGDFESKYEDYDGLTKNIRKVKEDTIGKIFTSSSQRKVSSYYDNNQLFFSMIEAYADPLQKLYDKESALIEQYGDVDLARSSQEFRDAVQEFSDATGLNGETAGKMLDWLETENRANQAVQVAKAQIAMVRARADAAVMGVDVGTPEGMDDVGKAMVYSQIDQMIKDEKREMFWSMLWEYLQAIIAAILPWKWGEVGGHLKKVAAYQQGIWELEGNRQKYYDDAMEYYENADRRDYGTDGYGVGDSPFGRALDSMDEQAYLEQQAGLNERGIFKASKLNGKAAVRGFKDGLNQHSPGDIAMAIADELQYVQHFLTVFPFKVFSKLAQKQTEEYQDNLGVGDVMNTGGRLSIGKKYDTSSKGSIIAKLQHLLNFGKQEDTQKEILFYQRNSYRELQDINKEFDVNKWYASGHNNGDNSVSARVKNALLYDKGFGLPSGVDPDNLEVQEELRRRQRNTATRAGAHGLGGYFNGRIPGLKGTIKQIVKTIAHILNPEEIESTIFNKIFKNGEKVAIEGGEKAAGKTAGKVAGEVIEEGGEKAAGKTLAKTAGKTLAKIAPYIGPIVTAAFAIAEHNPFETHYNEDGSEKRAFQSTGEVVGEVGGSLLAMGLSAFAGPFQPLAEMALSLVLEPVGKAVGGLFGYAIDEVWNGNASIFDPLIDIWGWGDSEDSNNTDNITPVGTFDNIDSKIYSDFQNSLSEKPIDNNVLSDGIQQNNNTSINQPKNTVVIKNININTEDDPEKIKSALMNLIIEMQEQINPRQVSRTVGEPPAVSNASTDQNQNNTTTAEGTDATSGTPNGNSNTNNNSNTTT